MISVRGRRLTFKRLRTLANCQLQDIRHEITFNRQSRHVLATLDTARRNRDFSAYYGIAQDILGLIQRRSEIQDLVGWLANLEPIGVMEVGTFKGGTNFLFSQAIPSVQLMLGIDLWVRNRRILRRLARAGQELYFVNSASSAPYALKRVERLLGDRTIDFLFIDGDHRYQGVKADFDNYKRFVRPGGWIGFHDIVMNHRASSANSGDVPLFWSQLQQHQEFRGFREFIESPGQDGFGIGVIPWHGDP